MVGMDGYFIIQEQFVMNLFMMGTSCYRGFKVCYVV